MIFDDNRIDEILKGVREPMWKVIPVEAMEVVGSFTLDKMNKLLKHGWVLNFSEGALNALIGDCNCPIDKDYDPKDGHGYTDLEFTGDTVEALIYQIWKKHIEMYGEKDA